MSLGRVIPETEMEARLIDAGNSAYSAAYLSRYYGRSSRANVFSEHRCLHLGDTGCAVVSFTANPWSGRSDVLFIFVQSTRPVSPLEYEDIIAYGVANAPTWGMNKAIVSVTDRQSPFQTAVRDFGFRETSQGFVVLTDLTDPLMNGLAEPSVPGLEITPLDEVSDPSILESVAQFVALNYRTVPMPFEVGPLDAGFMYEEIMDEITVKQASMVMHRDDEVCGFCHVIDVVGGGMQTEWPIIVVDEGARGQGIGFAASVRALNATRSMGFVRDVSFAAKTNVAVERQYSGYGGEVVGQYWKYMLDL